MNMKEFFRRLKLAAWPHSTRIEVFYEENKDGNWVNYLVWHRGKRFGGGVYRVNKFNNASDVFQRQCEIAAGLMLERIKSENI